ncbi:MAG: MFS transporter [Candidatus Micrarchaeaceae archaeon]
MESVPEKRILVGELFKDIPVTKFHWIAISVLFVAFAIEAWEFMVPFFTVNGLMNFFNVNYDIVGLLMSSAFFGALAGAYILAPIADIIGRKKTIILGLAGYSIFNLLTVFSPSNMWEFFFITRFIAGFFLIVVMVQPFPLLEEFLPVKVRGRMATYLAAGWPIGTMMLIGAVYLFYPTYGWQGVFTVSSLVALIWLGAIIFLLPESPYFLVSKNKQKEAKKIINEKIVGKENFVPENVQLYTVEIKEKFKLAALFKKDYVKYTILIFFGNFFFSFGYWGLFSWLPTILYSRGLTFVTTLDFVFISALAQFPGYFAAAYWEEKKIGRKKLLIIFLVSAAIGTFLFAYSYSFEMMIVSLIILSFFNLGGWGIWDIWQPELYPTELRGTVMGWIGGAQRVSNSIAPSLLGFLLAIHGISFDEIVILVAISLIVTALVIIPLKETRGEILL